MTECSPTPLTFSSLGCRRLHADFSGGALTTDAGMLLLRQADKRLGLLDALDHCIPDPRDPDSLIHPQRALLAQRIFAIAAGYEDLNDHQHLRHDPLWQVLADYQPDPQQPLASAVAWSATAVVANCGRDVLRREFARVAFPRAAW